VTIQNGRAKKKKSDWTGGKGRGWIERRIVINPKGVDEKSGSNNNKVKRGKEKEGSNRARYRNGKKDKS